MLLRSNSRSDRQSSTSVSLFCDCCASLIDSSSTDVSNRQPSCTFVPFSSSSGKGRRRQRWIRPAASVDGCPFASIHERSQPRSSTSALSVPPSRRRSAKGRSTNSPQPTVGAR